MPGETCVLIVDIGILYYGVNRVLGDADLFANAFAEDGIFQLDEKGPVFGFDKMIYQGRADIRSIITARLEKASKSDPKTLSFDPATLKMYNRNTDVRRNRRNGTHRAPHHFL